MSDQEGEEPEEVETEEVDADVSEETEEVEAETEADAETEEEATAEDEEAADEETTEEESGDGLADGDFITLEYTARTVEDDSLVDTTDREVAEEEGVAEEGHTFEPRTVVLGAGHLFPPVEDDIIGKDVGDSGSVVVEAAEAFGEYDDSQVRTISADKIPEDDRYPGAHVDVDGEHGHVETIIGGRARVDFNHPLAGEDIEYDYEILDTIEDREEKATALLKTYLDMALDVSIETEEVTETQPVTPEEKEEEEEGEVEVTDDVETKEVTVEKESLYIESTPQLAFNQQWMFQKQQIAQEIMDRVDVDRVVIQEIIDGSGMGGMMGGMGGMMPGMGGGPGGADIEDALEEADIDADELADELDDAEE